MSDSWKEFVDLIKGYGFEIVVRRRFEKSYLEEKPRHPEFLIAAHRQKYLLLCATSYIGSDSEEVLNGGTVYGTLDVSGKLNDEQWNVLMGCSGGASDFGYEFSYDVRGNLIHTLNRLGEVFKFIKWNDPNRFLWLMDYKQEEKKVDLWALHRDKFLTSAPKWVKEFILPDQEHSLLLKQKASTGRR